MRKKWGGKTHRARREEASDWKQGDTERMPCYFNPIEEKGSQGRWGDE